MKHCFSVGVREVHISHRLVWVEDKDGSPEKYSLEQRAISKAHECGLDNETFLEYSHTMPTEHSDIRAAYQEEIADTVNQVQ